MASNSSRYFNFFRSPSVRTRAAVDFKLLFSLLAVVLSAFRAPRKSLVCACVCVCVWGEAGGYAFGHCLWHLPLSGYLSSKTGTSICILLLPSLILFHSWLSLLFLLCCSKCRRMLVSNLSSTTAPFHLFVPLCSSGTMRHFSWH